MDTSINLESKIFGWGADLDPKNRMGVPKERTPPRDTGAHWDKPEQQISNYEVYHSIERPGITPVFGTSCPPRGISKYLRRAAYANFSEARLAHWMLLLLADRIDVVEGIVEDFLKGRVPNPYKEMGLKTEFTKNKGGVQTALAIAGAGLVTFAAYKWLTRSSGEVLLSGEEELA